MKYLYFLLFISAVLIYSCDENSNNITIDPGNSSDNQTSCFTPQEVSESECPADELTNICTTYSCSFTIGEIVSDGSFPPCPEDVNSCEFIDCRTLMCGDFIYFDINAAQNSLVYSFDSTDLQGEPIEVNVICFSGGVFSQTCNNGMN